MADQDDRFEAIEASEVALSQDLGQQRQAEASRHTAIAEPGVSTRLIFRYLIAATALILVALSLVFWQKLQPPPATEAITRAAPVDTPTTPDTTIDNVATDEQALRAQRRAAQDLLAEIMEKRASLEAREVSQWADTDYRAAQDEVKAGDDWYQKGRFQQATEAYRASLKQLNALVERIAPLLEQTLARGAAAIDRGAIEEARQAFTLALTLEPANEEAQTGLARLEQLPRVLDLLTEGERLLAVRNFDQALASFQQAVELDALNLVAKKRVDHTRNLINERNFSAALGQGFDYLQANSYPAAIAAFERALKLSPDSASARQALTQARSEYDQQRIKALLRDATIQEQQERWQDAVATHQAILAIDGSVVDATVGLARSRARADLDQALTQLIDAPVRLSASGVYQQAQQRLADARQLGAQGARLSRQMEQLENLLVEAITPITVRLVSDNQTSVIILRVAELGRFAEKQIQLKPGKYVAEGIRKGYRDVRVDFTVSGSGASGAIEIACTEAI